MKFKWLVLLILVTCNNKALYAAEDWSERDLDSLGAAAGCIEAPTAAGVNEINTNLTLKGPQGKWRPVGIEVSDGKFLGIKWSGTGVTKKPSIYKVMYRIDPRFRVPQVFIKKYNHNTQEYESDFHRYKSGRLLTYQAEVALEPNLRRREYDRYFSFDPDHRTKINVNSGDAVNIHLISASEFFAGAGEMTKELKGNQPDEYLTIYTESPIEDNRILHSDIGPFCNTALEETPGLDSCSASPASFIQNYTEIDKYSILLGKINNATFNLKKAGISACPVGAHVFPDARANEPICYYQEGQHLQIKIAGTNIKEEFTKFIKKENGKDFFYYISDATGALEFGTEHPVNDMFGNNSFMLDWDDADDYLEFKDRASFDFSDVKHFYFGRYLMHVEIGSASDNIIASDLDDIDLEYIILDADQVPTSSDVGTSVPNNFDDNANRDGYLWIRVNNNSTNLSGDISVSIASFTGSDWFSRIIYEDIVQPLQDRFRLLSEFLYQKLTLNASLKNIATALLTLYIIVYALLFLIGATQIKVTDLVTRVVKITIIVILFSPNSWNFFNEHVFKVFNEGAAYLMRAATGITSNADNIFGFIDPLFNKYTNPNLWALLLIQMLQITNGMIFLSILVVSGILVFFRAALEIIISYVIAFLGLSIMISLAPLFILLILFKRTQNMFIKWISVLFGYMLKPTLLLIFFLMLDQALGDLILGVVVRACWGILIPIEINLSFLLRGGDLSFSIPGFPGIPFYIPELNTPSSALDYIEPSGTFTDVLIASILFYLLTKLVKGLVDYSEQVVSYLADTQADITEGGTPGAIGSGGGNIVSSVLNDIKTGGGAFSKAGTKAKSIGRSALKKAGNYTSYDAVKASANKLESSRAKVDYSNFAGVSAQGAESSASSGRGASNSAPPSSAGIRPSSSAIGANANSSVKSNSLNKGAASGLAYQRTQVISNAKTSGNVNNNSSVNNSSVGVPRSGVLSQNSNTNSKTIGNASQQQKNSSKGSFSNRPDSERKDMLNKNSTNKKSGLDEMDEMD